MKKIVSILMVALVMVGCTNNDTKKNTADSSPVCKLEKNSETTQFVLVSADTNEELKTIEYELEYPLYESNFTDRSEEDVQKLVESQYIKKNESKEGITYDISVSQEKLEASIKISIDMNKADLEAISERLGFLNDKNIKNVKKDLEEKEFTCS